MAGSRSAYLVIVLAEYNDCPDRPAAPGDSEWSSDVREMLSVKRKEEEQEEISLSVRWLCFLPLGASLAYQEPIGGYPVSEVERATAHTVLFEAAGDSLRMVFARMGIHDKERLPQCNLWPCVLSH